VENTRYTRVFHSKQCSNYYFTHYAWPRPGTSVQIVSECGVAGTSRAYNTAH